MDDLKDQIAEYRALKAWLRGDKRPAQGRITWRTKVQAVLPTSVQRGGRAVARCMPFRPELFVATLLAGAMACTPLASFVPLDTLPPEVAVFVSLIAFLQPIIVVFGCVNMFFMSVSLLFQ